MKMGTVARNEFIKVFCYGTHIIISFCGSIITKANVMASELTLISRYYPKFGIIISYNYSINNSNMKPNIRFCHMKNEDKFDKKNNLIFTAFL